MAFSRRLEGHPYLSVNPFVCQPLCLSTPLSVNPFVSQPLWLALPTVRIPRNRLTPGSSSQANAASSPRPPFPFPFPFSFLFHSRAGSVPSSDHLPLSLFPPASLGIVTLPVPVPVPAPVPVPPPPPYPSTFWAQKRPFHSRLSPSRHFWLRIALFTPVCLLPVTSGSESPFSLPFASFPSLPGSETSISLPFASFPSLLGSETSISLPFVLS